MSPRSVGLLTGLATGVVALCTAYTAAIGGWGLALTNLTCGIAVAVAWVIVRYDPTSVIGPAVAWTTAPIALVGSHVGPLAALPWSSGAWPLNVAGLLALMLVFPAGELLSARWRIVPWVFLAATIGMIAAQWGARQEGGTVVGGPDQPWVYVVGPLALVTVGACLVLGAAALVLRYRRGSDRVRQQIRWLLLAGTAVITLLVAGWAAEILGASLAAAYTPFLVATIALVPAAVGIAIVRYDLFDVDRLLTGAASWLVTLLLSAAIFGAVVYVVSSVLAVNTGLTNGFAAFVTALALLPAQRHIAARVGRAVDHDRYVAVAEVEQFAADVRAGRRQPEEIEGVLQGVQNDPALSLTVARPYGGWARLDGTSVPRADGFDLEAGGDVIATIRKYHDHIGHYHTGGVPGRHEIDETQELNNPAVVRAILNKG